MSVPETRTSPATAGSRALLLVLAYFAFVSLGLPDTVSGVAWPSIRDTYRLPQSGQGLLSLGLASGYFLSSFLAGKLTQTMGVGHLLWVSSLLVAAAMFGIALSPGWLVIIGCAMVWGLGSGAIDGGLNGYVSARFSAKHVNWLHACYSLGATLGPLVMTATLLALGSWRLGYALVGAVILVMTVAFFSTRQLWEGSHEPAHADERGAATMLETLQSPLVWLQLMVFVVYCGLESTLVQWTFTLMRESRGVSAELAGILASVYVGSIGVGRVGFGAVADWIGVDRLLRLSTFTAFLGGLLLAFGTPREVGFAGLALIGLGLAPVFPCLMSRTPQRLGPRLATHAVGFQVSAAMVGIATLPGAAGLLGQWYGLEWIPRFTAGLAFGLWALHELLVAKTTVKPPV